MKFLRAVSVHDADGTLRFILDLREYPAMRFSALLVALLFPLLGQANEPNYAQAFRYSTDNLRPLVYDSAVTPNWIGKTDQFWYSFRTSQGIRFWRVDAKKATREPLFDHAKVAALLSETQKKPFDADRLPITRGSISDDGVKFKFVADEFQFELDRAAMKLTKLGKAPPLPAFTGQRGGERRRDLDQQQLDQMQQQQQQQQDQQQQQQQQQRQQQDQQQQRTGGRGGFGQRSSDYRTFAPDMKVYVFAKKYNLYLAEAEKEKDAIALSKDGVEDYGFGGTPDDKPSRVMAIWSSDSKAFTIQRSDTRGVKELFVINSLAEPRPTLEKYKYPMPGEEATRKSELYVFRRDTSRLIRVPAKWKDEGYSNIHWGKTSEEVRFIRRDRPRRHIELCSFNVVTGQTKCLIADGFENTGIEYQNVRYVDESDEMIWWSERTGWGHFYLYGRDGTLKNAITSGPFRASRIVSVDAKSRILYFQGNGREPGENIYYQHLYRVHFDGSGMTLLDPGNASHNSTLSSSNLFVVDNSSRIDQAPTAVVRDATGKKVLDLETMDLSRLTEAGWKMPETFIVKAADGTTDLYGNMWKPFDFDPKKKYPIIANVYPGPQTEGVTHTFSALSPNQQLAQLGFIVVQVGHRGGAPTRSKAYASYGYFNLRDYGLADKKAAIEHLAAKCPFIDVSRVGIFGHSGGGFMSAAALMQKPYNEFFKAAVASAGNHDNNIYGDYWAERYHGLKEVEAKAEEKKDATKKDDAKKDEKKDSSTTPDTKNEGSKADASKPGSIPPPAPMTRFEIKVPTNAELAANLKGALLLVHGESDNNVHPANTMRLVDALIKANKRFDMLIIPGKRHGFGDAQPYFTQRMWDFFVEHLMGHRVRSADLFDKQLAK